MDKKKKKGRVWVFILIGVILAAAAAILILARSAANRRGETAYREYEISRGSVYATITGSGRLSAADTATVELPDGVKVSEVPVQAGDAVRAGDVIAVLDSGSLENRAAALYEELAALDRTIAVRDTSEAVMSPAEGRIKYLPAGSGDGVAETVGEYGALAVISTDGLMKVVFTTNGDAELFSRVTVKWDGGSAKGVIASRSGDETTVTLPDGSAPYGERAQVYIGEVLAGEGTLEINAPVAVTGQGGRIDTVECRLNGKVKLNEKLFTLDDEYATGAYLQALSDRNDAAERLAAVLAYSADPVVRAETDGTVSAVYAAEGEPVGAANATDTDGLSAAMELAVGGAVKMEIDVDELDIGSVKLGQDASVTLDAYPNEQFAAKVTRISYIGEAAGSITTYPVEITLEYDGRLLSGMNGSAVIASDSTDGALLIPIEAIYEDSTGIYVYVVTEEGGRERRDIETGLSDGTYAEVRSGLFEGDTVSYEAAAQSMFPFTPPFAGGTGRTGGTDGREGE